MYYASDREFDPVYGSFDNSWTYPNPTRLVAVPLRKDVASPLAARNDAENPALDVSKPEPKTEQEKKEEEKKDAAKAADAPNVDIDIEGFESRAIVLPPKSGNYADLQASGASPRAAGNDHHVTSLAGRALR